jgi:hypothetical protein
MGIFRTRVSLKVMRGSKDCIALIGTGVAMTVIDRIFGGECRCDVYR